MPFTLFVNIFRHRPIVYFRISETLKLCYKFISILKSFNGKLRKKIKTRRRLLLLWIFLGERQWIRTHPGRGNLTILGDLELTFCVSLTTFRWSICPGTLRKLMTGPRRGTFKDFRGNFPIKTSELGSTPIGAPLCSAVMRSLVPSCFSFGLWTSSVWSRGPYP